MQMYVQEVGTDLNVLLRVPLDAMRDISFAQRGPGYLDVEAARAQLSDAVTLWIAGNLNFDLDGQALGLPELIDVRLALPSDRSFVDLETARGVFAAPRLSADTELYWEQALLDVSLQFALPGAGELFFSPGFARLGLRTLLEVQYLPEADDVRNLVLIGDPGRVSLSPGVSSVFASFAAAGFEHVLSGIDHLLFLVALLLPIRRLQPLVVIVTAFTLAHSLTLSAAVFNLVPGALWFVPVVELLVAASIVFMAFENIILPGLDRRWLIAYGFGLIHGFAFSFSLGETLQFAGVHIPAALLAFNLGIEAAQLLVLLLALLVLRWLLRFLPEKPTVIVLSALIAHSGWHWLTERFAILQQYSFGWPVFDAALLAMAARWLILVLVAIFIVWLARTLAAHFNIRLDGRAAK